MEGSIFILKNKPVADIIIRGWQLEKYPQVQENVKCRYIRIKRSICDGSKKLCEDTSDVKKASAKFYLRAERCSLIQMELCANIDFGKRVKKNEKEFRLPDNFLCGRTSDPGTWNYS